MLNTSVVHLALQSGQAMMGVRDVQRCHVVEAIKQECSCRDTDTKQISRQVKSATSWFRYDCVPTLRLLILPRTPITALSSDEPVIFSRLSLHVDKGLQVQSSELQLKETIQDGSTAVLQCLPVGSNCSCKRCSALL